MMTSNNIRHAIGFVLAIGLLGFLFYVYGESIR